MSKLIKYQQFTRALVRDYPTGGIFTLTEVVARYPQFSGRSIKYWLQVLTSAGDLQRLQPGVYQVQHLHERTAAYSPNAKIPADDPEHIAWMAFWRQAPDRRRARMALEQRA